MCLIKRANHSGLLKSQTYSCLPLKNLTVGEDRVFLNFYLMQKGLRIFLSVCLPEQDLVLKEKEKSWGCSHDCSNCHKLKKCFQLCLYCAIVYLACSHSAVGGSSKHSCVYYFCPLFQYGFWGDIILTNMSNLTFTPCLVNKWLESMLMVTVRECVECRGGCLEGTSMFKNWTRIEWPASFRTGV